MCYYGVSRMWIKLRKRYRISDERKTVLGCRNEEDRREKFSGIMSISILCSLPFETVFPPYSRWRRFDRASIAMRSCATARKRDEQEKRGRTGFGGKGRAKRRVSREFIVYYVSNVSNVSNASGSRRCGRSANIGLTFSS